jgi:hypothetical protein
MSEDAAYLAHARRAEESHDVVGGSRVEGHTRSRRPATHLAHTPRACPLGHGAPLRPAHTARPAPSALPGLWGVRPGSSSSSVSRTGTRATLTEIGEEAAASTWRTMSAAHAARAPPTAHAAHLRSPIVPKGRRSQLYLSVVTFGGIGKRCEFEYSTSCWIH